jgi:hypothetical protein
MRSNVFTGAVVMFAVAGFAAAETTPTLPPGFVLPHGQHDVRKATAGAYTADVMHTAVIARISLLDERVPLRQIERDAAMGPGAYREV